MTIQRAVAAVIINRVRHRLYPNTICGVVTERRQFTGWMREPSSRDPVWHRIRQLAADIEQELAVGTFTDPTSGATHFHSYAMIWRYPAWAEWQYKTVAIGGHTFYRLPRR